MTTDKQIEYQQNSEFVINQKRMTTIKDLIRDYGRNMQSIAGDYQFGNESTAQINEREEELLNELMKKIKKYFD